MKTKKVFIFAWLIALCYIGIYHVNAQNHAPSQGSTYNIDFVDIDYASKPDSFTIRFNIRDGQGEKKYLDVGRYRYRILEKGKELNNPKPVMQALIKEGDRRSDISQNITVSLLVDRSKDMTEGDMAAIKDAVQSMVERIPEGCAYISFFGDDITATKLITSSNFDEFRDYFKPSDRNKSLYNAMYMKLEEFSGKNERALNAESGYILNHVVAGRAKTTKNYLVVLTDGNDKPKGNDNIRLAELNNFADTMSTEIKLFAIRYGNPGKISEFYEIDDVLKAICYSRDVKPELRGDFFKASPDSVLSRLDKVIEDITPDYIITLATCGRTYTGITDYRIEMEGEMAAYGEKKFIIGSPEKPIICPACDEKDPFFGLLGWGLLIGAIFLLVIFIILQLIVPLIRNAVFKARYYKRYKPAPKERVRLCHKCRGEIDPGDRIVDCCGHIVHEKCWIEGGYQCPEYGQNCKKGKQNFFNINDPFSVNNKQSYLGWVLYGLLGGFLTWICYMFLFRLFPDIFASLSAWMARVFYLGFSGKSEIFQHSILYILQNKISGLLAIGILLGFLLSLFFSLYNEYRKKSFKVFLVSLLRAICGAALGFAAFFIGSIIMLLFSPTPDTTLWWLYSVPGYLLFGTAIGWCLSVKSTISWKHGVLGGAISILIGFVILYTSTALLKEYGTMLTFMIYGAGLGFSIATVRSYSEHYFLKVRIDKAKEKDIAIHKWMNASGGSRVVYIGMSNECEIQMNWENDPGVEKKHAKLFYDNSKKMIMLHALEQGISYNNRLEIKRNNQLQLVNGDEFRIGGTTFQYYEKD